MLKVYEVLQEYDEYQIYIKFVLSEMYIGYLRSFSTLLKTLEPFSYYQSGLPVVL